MTRFWLGAFGFALMVVYCPYINGAGTTPRWLVIGVALIVLAVFVGSSRITWAHIIGAAFLGWECMTYLWTASPLDAVGQLWKLPALAGLFILGSKIEDMRPFYIGCAAGLAVSSVLVILDLAELIHYAQAVRPGGLFVNELYLAEITVMIGSAFIVDATYWSILPLVVLAPSIFLLPMPRGPILALSFALVIELWQRSRPLALSFLAGGAALVAVMILPHWREPFWRPIGVTQRLAMWSDVVNATTPLGRGIGSYFATAPLIASQYDAVSYRPDFLHNDLLEIFYETGIAGLGLALGFCFVILTAPGRRREKVVIGAFLVEGCFGFPIHLPATAAVFAIAAGHIAGGLPHWLDSAIGWRISFFAGRARHARGDGRTSAPDIA